MKYDQLSSASWVSQVERLEKARASLAARDDLTSSGRVIPDAEDLVYGTGRRLRAAVLFLDISGFSGRASESHREQELVLRALTFFFTEMVRVAEDYGGTVEKNTGDGLMAYFEDGGGTPGALGSLRAVPCALTMFYVALNAINPVIGRSGLDPLRFRIGIDAGWVTIAKLGAARRFGSIATVGTTANIACKMLGMADPDELLIGEAVKKDLPVLWQLHYCHRLAAPSGWTYRHSGAEYPFYRYTGRWTRPA